MFGKVGAARRDFLRPVLLTAVFASMFLSFMRADMGDSARLQAYSDEPKIYYRLARSNERGILSDAGLLGFCENSLKGKERKVYSIAVYLEGRCPNYGAYESQSGVQGLFYSLIDKFYKNPLIFRILCAAFLAAVLTAWFAWLCVYFDLIPSFLAMLSILSFRDLMSNGNNIAQVLGATYLIMVVMFWAYEKKIERLGVVAFSVVLLKLLLNGFEYIFSALLLPFLPLVFYAIANGMPVRRTMRDLFSIARGTALACLVSFLILTAQVSAVDSPTGAMHHFINRVTFRMSLDERRTRIGATRLQVLSRFLSFHCLSIGHFDVSFGAMILFFSVVGILSYFLYRRFKDRALLALLATTVASLLCPVSYILLAHGHAARESHDQLVWHMPFTLLGAALTVVTLKVWIGRRTLDDANHHTDTCL